MIRLWLVALLALPVVSCSSTPDCLPTKLEVAPIDVPGPTAPITLSARLTQGDRPVVGAKVGLAFAINTEGMRGGMPTKVATDSDGVATIEEPGGINSVGVQGSRTEGYEASFQPLTTADGFNDHCWSNASAPITCAGAACPPVPKP
ncbi:hypothetical protein FKR81_28620 [Lentzea tibetensis]|uniref:Big-1 domain-containing protein n=1 Tax=Lentzea tibetensis TaxID=2591470 RepID=A0A563EM53_9PSEU|nr:hypothetical protein [Lentzea tibetensis]TWP48261.1 hypothetical protein FKR81_28620 [Lentzea tibetensis]